MDSNSDINLVWEWEKAKDKWCLYSKEKIDLFNKFLSKNRTQGNFEENEVKFNVDFVKMMQKNTGTGFERKIRCAIESSDEKNVFYVWQWLDEKNKWQTYNNKISIDLEKEFRAKNVNSVSFVVSGRSYSIDLSKMEQLNDTSMVSRKVQRVISDAEENVQLPAKPILTASKRKIDEIKAEDDKEVVVKSTKMTKNDSITIKKSSKTIKKSREASVSSYEEMETSSKKSVGKIKLESNGDEDDEMLTLKIKKSSAKKVESDEEEDEKASKSTKAKRKVIESDDDEDEKPLKSLKAVSKSTKAKRKVIEIDDDDEDEKSLKSVSKSTKSKSKSSATVPKSNIRTYVVKGKAPVDPECKQKVGKAHVYYEGSNVYDCMLNQTNVQNNNNKYYIIQLLEDDKSKQYFVWQRWGRVGFAGQNNLIPFGSDLDEAKESFCKKFNDKTKNEWCDRKDFKKIPGKYDLIEMDYALGEQGTSSDKTNDKKKVDVDSKLDTKIQNLLKLICDVDAMESAVREMKFDADKSPLGKLTGTQIKAGYLALKKIEKCIETNSFGKSLVDACNEFYTRIPHCFGMKTPPLIRDTPTLKEKINLLEALADIEVAIRTLKSETDEDCNPLDRHYAAMKCELKPLNHESEQFKMIEKYLKDTHATTHNMYKMKLSNVYECDKDGESANYKDVGNKMLLWHGSRLTNWYGILSQGLRIAPPEAPVTGYMFGKGVYFADISSKSANYCFATKQKNVGLVALCEVSLGKTHDCTAADYSADKLSANLNSTRGLGRVVPDPKDIYVTDYGCLVPYGKPKDITINNRAYALNYNEYVVYDTRQIKMRYLVEIEFIFA